MIFEGQPPSTSVERFGRKEAQERVKEHIRKVGADGRNLIQRAEASYEEAKKAYAESKNLTLFSRFARNNPFKKEVQRLDRVLTALEELAEGRVPRDWSALNRVGFFVEDLALGKDHRMSAQFYDDDRLTKESIDKMMDTLKKAAYFTDPTLSNERYVVREGWEGEFQQDGNTKRDGAWTYDEKHNRWIQQHILDEIDEGLRTKDGAKITVLDKKDPEPISSPREESPSEAEMSSENDKEDFFAHYEKRRVQNQQAAYGLVEIAVDGYLNGITDIENLETCIYDYFRSLIPSETLSDEQKEQLYNDVTEAIEKIQYKKELYAGFGSLEAPAEPQKEKPKKTPKKKGEKIKVKAAPQKGKTASGIKRTIFALLAGIIIDGGIYVGARMYQENATGRVERSEPRPRSPEEERAVRNLDRGSGVDPYNDEELWEGHERPEALSLEEATRGTDVPDTEDSVEEEPTSNEETSLTDEQLKSNTLDTSTLTPEQLVRRNNLLSGGTGS